MSDCSKHVPVLLHETIKYLNLSDTGIYVDATLGMGGYSSEILKHSNCRLISIDRDPEAISNAHSLKRKFGVRFTVVNDLFSNLEKILKNLNIDKINGIAFDFGVSSPQIDNPNRGFSFRFDSPLDMRMGRNVLSAADFINNNDRKTIENILKNFGEEKKARQISKAIVSSRPITTTRKLTNVIYSVLGGPKRNQIDPATRTFQAIRIAVNNELEEMQLGLNASLKLLAPKGRITAVSFHSLEDRIVKKFIIQNSSMQSNSNRHFPQTSKNKPKLKIISKKPITPSENEIDANPRSSSAKLRVAEKIEYKIKPSYEAA